jgi:hypothetical protein
MVSKQKIETKFVICLRNEGAEDLLPGKVYQILPDEIAARDDYIRIVDESGEDYLYPANYFIPIDLPRAAARALFPMAGD